MDEKNKITPRQSGRRSVIELNSAPRNSKGGIHVSDKDIELAFDFFGQNEGKITAASMRKMLLALNKKLTKKELMTIFGGKNSIAMQEVKNLLRDNTVVCDPVVEAFGILDPTNGGFLQEGRLNKIFSNLGYGELTEEELVLLIEMGDFDRDGKLGIEDFRKLSRPNNEEMASEGAGDNYASNLS